MKKQLMTLALAAVVGSACADYVESSNIVGYEKVDLAANTYFISGVQFVKVGGENASLNDLLSGVPYGTEVLFMNERGTYDVYKYIAEAYDEVSDDFIPGWGDVGEEYNYDGFDCGVGFWVKTPSVSQLNQVGEVPNSKSFSVSLPADKYVLVSNGIPAGFNPNAATWTNLEYGTELLVQNERGTYDVYKYIAEAYDEVSDDFIPGWGDVGEEIVTTPITNPGKGFWLKSPVSTELTISVD